MEPRPLICPACGAEIKRDSQIRAHRPFACPTCGRLLRISSLYFWIPLLAGTAGCGLLGYAFGVRGMALAVFIVLLWFPISVLLGIIGRVYSNPKIRVHHSDNLDLTGKS